MLCAVPHKALKVEAGEYLLVLGMEELDETLKEVRALPHLTFSSFDKVLAEDRTRNVTQVRSW